MGRETKQAPFGRREADLSQKDAPGSVWALAYLLPGLGIVGKFGQSEAAERNSFKLIEEHHLWGFMTDGYMFL